MAVIVVTFHIRALREWILKVVAAVHLDNVLLLVSLTRRVHLTVYLSNL